MKRGPQILTGGLAVVVASAMAAVGAPGAYAAGTVSGDVDITNTETVQVLMGADGSIDAQRIYEQLVLKGNGKVDIANPVSAKGLRNLDGFGGFDERDGQMRIDTTVDGSKKYRSVSDYTKSLPLKVEISYELDGKKVDPQDVVGKSGTLHVQYKVTNVTGQQQDVSYEDGDGKQQSTSEDVVIPMVGSLTTVLPSTFTEVQSAEANAAGDGRGGTQLSFTMTLIPPIGSDTASFGYTAKVKDARIPKATMSALPVNPLESPSFKGGAASYAGGAETGQTLTAGATEIDSNVLKLRDGASDLVAGLLKMQTGAGQLQDGSGKLKSGSSQLKAEGTGKIASGASRLRREGTAELAVGAGALDAGAGKLRDGASVLSGGLQQMGASAPALLGGLDSVAQGLDQVSAGLAQLNSMVVPGANQISAGATQLLGAIDAQLSPGLDSVTGALDSALSIAAGLDEPAKTQLTQLIGGAKSGVATVKGGLNTSVKGGLSSIKTGGDKIAGGVDGATGTDGSLVAGVGALQDGVGELQAGGGALAQALGQAATGASQLATGAGDLKSGTSDLKSGALRLDGKAAELSAGATKLDTKMGSLSVGAAKIAAGINKLAAGIDEAAEGAPKLPEGADRLSEEGMSQLIEAGNSTAMDYGLKYALIEAGAARAGDAQPYGSPDGAVALTAYKFEIAGADDTGSKNVTRGIAAVVLLAAAAGVPALRRRLA